MNTTKSMNVKALVAKGTIAAVAAGAMILAGASQAEAQGFAVQVGHPYFAHDRGFYERQRAEEFRRHEEFLRRQEFAHRHFYVRPYGYR